MEQSYSLPPGSLLYHNTYRIERVLGQGGFGITYLATDLSLGIPVAIKEFFPKNFCRRDGSTSLMLVSTQANTELVHRLRQKFIKEARHIARINHRNIIRIYSAFEQNDTAYYAMQFIEGRSLAEVVAANGPMPEHLALTIIEKIGGALDYLHKQNINHLDVKPANIMIRQADYEPYLIDFGLSKQYDNAGSQTSTTPVGVSHGYAPLEQYNPGGVAEFSPSTDIYSLAATLYYILTGIVPPNAQTLYEESLQFPPTFPTRLIPAIRRAMQPRRKDRQPSVIQFIAELKNTSPYGETTDYHAIPSGDATHVAGQSSSSRKHNVAGQSPRVVNTSPDISDYPKRKNSSKWLMFIAIAAVAALIVCLIYIFGNNNGSDVKKYQPGEQTFETEAPTEIPTVDLNAQAQGDSAKAEEVATRDAAEDAKAQAMEVARDAVADTPKSTRDGLEGYILNSPEVTYNGKECHFFQGYFAWEDKQWDIMVVFIVENGRVKRAVYKNIKYDALFKLSTSFSGNSVSLSGNTAHHYLDMYLSLSGDGMSGTANSQSNDYSVRLTPTTRTFSF